MSRPAIQDQAMHSTAIQLSEVTRLYSGRAVLRDLDLRVPAGSLYGLIGLNGAGKTTTLRICLGLLAADRGSVEVLGVAAARLASIAPRVGATLHLAGLDPRLSARDNLCHHALMHGRRPDRVDAMLRRLDLDYLAKRRVGRVSQGERQRLALARALLLEPEVLVLDEPLTHLDPGAVDGVLSVLRDEVKGRGASVLLSSHQLEHVERSCDRLALLHAGRVLIEGATVDLLRGASRRLWLRAAPGERVLHFLRQQSGVGTVSVLQTDAASGAIELRLDGCEIEAAQLNAALHRAGLSVSGLAPEQRSLDALFREAIAATRGAALEVA